MALPDKPPFVPTGDALIDEIRAIRHNVSAQFDHDVNRLVEHLREIERLHPGRVLQPADVRALRKPLKAS
jgi:hypothetical protein